MTGLKRRLTSDFVPEWCALGALALLDAAWAAHIHLSFFATAERLCGPGAGVKHHRDAACIWTGCWAFRKTGIISDAIMTLNIVMLCAVPFFGGHYRVDMVAGAAAMLLALAILKTAPLLTRKPSAASASPESAAASGGAY